jgi:hypothetical protein
MANGGRFFNQSYRIFYRRASCRLAEWNPARTVKSCISVKYPYT